MELNESKSTKIHFKGAFITEDDLISYPARYEGMQRYKTQCGYPIPDNEFYRAAMTSKIEEVTCKSCLKHFNLKGERHSTKSNRDRSARKKNFCF